MNPATQHGELHAAVDLGSNSFHLLIGARHGGEFIVLERLKQKVQLLGGFEAGRMRPEAIARGLDCIAGFAQRLAGVPRPNIRVMGTCALRQAHNRAAFTGEAEALLGVPVEIISGDEEARLIDLGVADHLEPPARGSGEVSRLVVDIGGGSTEFALSANGHSHRRLERTWSLPLGCVRFTDQYFSPPEMVPSSYPRAKAAAEAVLREAGLTGIEATQVIGTSGSIESIAGVLEVNGWSEGGIRLAGLAEAQAALLDRRWISHVGLPGLPPERVDIFPAGVAILAAVFDVLGIERMEYVGASLLQGMLHDDSGVAHSVQASAVDALAARFRVDSGQAARVQRQAAALAQEAGRNGWQIGEQAHRALDWAARLHEIGLAIAPASYHRHGAYLLGNAALRGFSKAEQNDVALLVRGHRRSFPALAYRALPEDRRTDIFRAMVLLRLAVILERGHDASRSPAEVRLRADAQGLALTLPPGWLAANLLSARELEVEQRQLAGVQLGLTFR